MLLSVVTSDLEDAAAALTGVGDRLDETIAGTVVPLRDVTAGMAGNDPAGASWAASYDPAARAAVAAAADAVTSCFLLSSLFAATSRNYAGADALSDPRLSDAAMMWDGGPPLDPPSATFDATGLPSSEGGLPLIPDGWQRIEALVGRVWPNGHQDRLRAAAAQWRASANALSGHAWDVQLAVLAAIRDGLPECEDMDRVCAQLTARLERIAHVHRLLEHACLDYADQLDRLHREFEHEVLVLGVQTVVINGLAVGFTELTAGGSDAAAYVVDRMRLSALAAKVAQLIDLAVDAVRAAADALSVVSGAAQTVRISLESILAMRPTLAVLVAAGDVPTTALVFATRTASTADVAGAANAASTVSRELEDVAQSPLPRLPDRLDLSQLERKFKHAPDFGVQTARGRAGFDELDKALRTFIEEPSTVRIEGTFRGSPAVVFYNPSSGLSVVQHSDGSLWSFYKLSPKQLTRLIETGNLGIE